MHVRPAMGLRGSQTFHHAFDFQAWLAEIEQQAEMQAGRFEVIDALHTVRAAVSVMRP